jgi:hypothetical protein
MKIFSMLQDKPVPFIKPVTEALPGRRKQAELQHGFTALIFTMKTKDWLYAMTVQF